MDSLCAFNDRDDSSSDAELTDSEFVGFCEEIQADLLHMVDAGLVDFAGVDADGRLLYELTPLGVRLADEIRNSDPDLYLLDAD